MAQEKDHNWRRTPLASGLTKAKQRNPKAEAAGAANLKAGIRFQALPVRAQQATTPERADRRAQAKATG